jgi:tetratricopeptide (TPR) repeat protein
MCVKESRGPGQKFVMSSGLVTSGLLVLLGTAGIGLALWAPIIKTVHDPRKQIADTLSVTIASAGIDQATQQYYNLKATEPANYNFEERQLDKLGYKLLKAKKFKEAIRIFQLNIETYPSSNAYDSLGEAYMRAGYKPEAILNCQKSLQINPKNGHSIEMLKELNAH